MEVRLEPATLAALDRYAAGAGITRTVAIERAIARLLAEETAAYPSDQAGEATSDQASG
jgi:predicted transcriptional regulator